MSENKKSKALICPQCGSNNVTLLSDELGKCNNCGCSISFKDNAQTVINNVTFNDSSNGKSEKTVFYSAIKPEFSKTDFARETYVDLSADANTPEDILTAAFLPATSCFENYVIVNGDAESTYSATIGYNVKKEYREYDSVNKKYVTKTKTVTEWQPFSGKYSGNFNEFVYNGEKSDRSFLKNSAFETQYSSSKSVAYESIDFEAEPPKAPSSEAVSSAKSGIAYQCKKEAEKNLPGDKNKDFKSGETVTVNSVESCSAPLYTTEYTYKNEKFYNSAFAFNGYNGFGNRPDYSQKMTDVVNKKTRPLTLSSLIANVLSIVLCFIFMISHLNKVLCLVPVATVLLHIVAIVVYKKLLNNVLLNNQNGKKEKLKNYLSKNNLAPLTEEELKKFKVNNYNKLAPVKQKIKSIGNVMFVINILCLGAFLMF